MLLDDELIRRFREQEVIPVIQPEFITRLGDAYVLGLGEERAARLNPVASLRLAGIPVPFSSDCPIVPGRPLDGIRAAVKRVTRNGRRLGASEEITAAEALRNYTYWAAYASFDEGETGTIAPGLRADLTVLSGDPTDESAIDSLKVVATIVGGEVVYGGDALN
jgi:predicted amidohydrolase YtcJ